MTEAMPFLQKAILLSYDPRPLCRGLLCSVVCCNVLFTIDNIDILFWHISQANYVQNTTFS